MALFARKLKIPSPEEALPGRSARMPVPRRHAVNGAPLEPPFPEGLERAVFGMGCFWGAERKFWEADGVYTTAVGYAGGHTPNPTYEEVCSGRTGHAEVVLVVFDPRRTSYDTMLKIFWESHDPTQGMQQGNDVGTQYRSGIYWYSESQRAAAERSREAYQRALSSRRPRRDHHRDRAGAGVLLRRGLPPAVPREEPGRVLRPRRNGRELPGRDRRGRRPLTVKEKTMDIEVGYQAFVSDGGEEFGAVRAVTPDFVLVWVENAGELRLPRDAVQDVHSQKVIFDCRKLDRRVREAIGHAHEAEEPGL